MFSTAASAVEKRTSESWRRSMWMLPIKNLDHWFLSTALNFCVIQRIRHSRLGQVVRLAFTNSSVYPTSNVVHVLTTVDKVQCIIHVWNGNQSKEIQYVILDSKSWLTFLFHGSFFHSLWFLYKPCRITLTITNYRVGRVVTTWTCLKTIYSNYWHYLQIYTVIYMCGEKVNIQISLIIKICRNIH